MFLCKWRARKQISLHRDNKVVLYCIVLYCNFSTFIVNGCHCPSSMICREGNYINAAFRWVYPPPHPHRLYICSILLIFFRILLLLLTYNSGDKPTWSADCSGSDGSTLLHTDSISRRSKIWSLNLSTANHHHHHHLSTLTRKETAESVAP